MVVNDSVASSEKVDKWARYSDFLIASMPYPGEPISLCYSLWHCIGLGCEFFKDYKDNGLNPVSLQFDWSQVSYNETTECIYRQNGCVVYIYVSVYIYMCVCVGGEVLAQYTFSFSLFSTYCLNEHDYSGEHMLYVTELHRCWPTSSWSNEECYFNAMHWLSGIIIIKV